MNADTIFLALVVFLAAWLLEKVLLIFILPLLAGGGAARPNYRQELVPTAGGVTFFITVIFCYTVMKLSGFYGGETYGVYLVLVVVMSLLGLLDDLLGRRDALGFRGHFARLFKKGELTTGALKAIGGGLAALYASLFFSRGWLEVIINTFVIGMFTNTMNLFDLRPGRCIKAFLLAFIPLLVVLPLPAEKVAFIPIVGAALAFFPSDLKAQAMLGDAGSNVLGVTLGVMAALGLGLEAKGVVLVFLLALNFFAERKSLTEIIEKSRILSWFDRLGRGG